MIIRNCISQDAEKIAEIYNHYIVSSHATFEEESLSTETILNRINETAKNYPWLVCEDEGKILGYVYAGPWKTRSAYRFTCEATIYLDANCCARGIGQGLYEALIQLLKENACRVVVACISLPNDASVAFHEKCGFKKVAHFEKVGYKFGKWIDVGYWQLNIPKAL